MFEMNAIRKKACIPVSFYVSTWVRKIIVHTLLSSKVSFSYSVWLLWILIVLGEFFVVDPARVIINRKYKQIVYVIERVRSTEFWASIWFSFKNNSVLCYSKFGPLLFAMQHMKKSDTQLKNIFVMQSGHKLNATGINKVPDNIAYMPVTIFFFFLNKSDIVHKITNILLKSIHFLFNSPPWVSSFASNLHSLLFANFFNHSWNTSSLFVKQMGSRHSIPKAFASEILLSSSGTDHRSIPIFFTISSAVNLSNKNWRTEDIWCASRFWMNLCLLNSFFAVWPCNFKVFAKLSNVWISSGPSSCRCFSNLKLSRGKLFNSKVHLLSNDRDVTNIWIAFSLPLSIHGKQLSMPFAFKSDNLRLRFSSPRAKLKKSFIISSVLRPYSSKSCIFRRSFKWSLNHNINGCLMQFLATRYGSDWKIFKKNCTYVWIFTENQPKTESKYL